MAQWPGATGQRIIGMLAGVEVLELGKLRLLMASRRALCSCIKHSFIVELDLDLDSSRHQPHPRGGGGYYMGPELEATAFRYRPGTSTRPPSESIYATTVTRLNY